MPPTPHDSRIKDLVANLRREVDAFSAGSDDRLSSLWSALDDLDQEFAEDAPDDSEIAELTETVAMFRQTATRREDALPVLAGALYTLSRVHRRAGRAEAAVPFAEEQVTIRRSLTAANSEPRRHTDYACALGELGRTLFLADRNREASVVVQEAATVARGAMPATWGTLFDLADYLSLLSSCLNRLERHQESLAAAEERVSLETQLRLADPTGDPAQLANALGWLGRRLAMVKRYSAAVSASREAVTLYRKLVAAGAASTRYDLADELRELRYHAEDAGKWPEAVTAGQEEVALRRELPAREGTTDAVDLATALKDLAVLLRRNRKFAEMMPVAEEAVARYRTLAYAGLLEPLEMWQGRGLAVAIDLIQEQLVATRRYGDALANAREQVALYRYLTTVRPDIHLPDLAEALIDFADLLDATDDQRQATSARVEANSIRS